MWIQESSPAERQHCFEFLFATHTQRWPRTMGDPKTSNW